MLLGTECVDKCPEKYYVDSGACMPCEPKCKACVNKVNYCINGCEQPFLFKDNRCLVECGSGFTGINGFCESCPKGCSECIYENNQKVCIKCIENSFLFNGTCSTSCPLGYYPEIETGLCELCLEACAECFGKSFKDCYSCNFTSGYMMVAENTCAFPTCTDGSYYNRTQRLCMNCPKECTKCENSLNCTECIKGYSLDFEAKRCFDPCDKLGYMRKPGTYDCTEICGDGRNMGIYECDDGNNKDNDGCSADCKIEKFYACSGGDANRADICINRKPLEITSFKYYGNRTAKVTFSSRAKLVNDINSKTELRLATSLSDEQIDWEYAFEFNSKNFRSIMYQLNFNHSLTGDEVFFIKSFIKKGFDFAF